MILYTRNAKDDQTATYDCSLCGNYELDVDGARAHQAVHAAGPELLAALKGLTNCPDVNVDEVDVVTADAMKIACAAILKAEPKGAISGF